MRAPGHTVAAIVLLLALCRAADDGSGGRRRARGPKHGGRPELLDGEARLAVEAIETEQARGDEEGVDCEDEA